MNIRRGKNIRIRLKILGKLMKNLLVVYIRKRKLCWSWGRICTDRISISWASIKGVLGKFRIFSNPMRRKYKNWRMPLKDNRRVKSTYQIYMIQSITLILNARTSAKTYNNSHHPTPIPPTRTPSMLCPIPNLPNNSPLLTNNYPKNTWPCPNITNHSQNSPNKTISNP